MNKYQQLPSAFEYFHQLDGRIPIRSKLKISYPPKNRNKRAWKRCRIFWVIEAQKQMVSQTCLYISNKTFNRPIWSIDNKIKFQTLHYKVHINTNISKSYTGTEILHKPHPCLINYHLVIENHLMILWNPLTKLLRRHVIFFYLACCIDAG